MAGLMLTSILSLIFFLPCIQVLANSWSPEAQSRPDNMPSLQSLDVTCYKNHMTVTAEFNNRFHGTIFSKGSSNHEGCTYVSPHSGMTKFQFDIQYDKCGTKPDMNGKLYENTIVIQYGTDLIEVWDEAKRLRCEWFNDYQKTQAANPPVLIEDLEEVQQEFVGDHVEVWMEIQEGKGPWRTQVSGIVPLGSTLTLVVAINDPSKEFDMLVRSCVASDGVRQPLMLSDEYGCIMRPKMFSSFKKERVQDARATVITYAHFPAFKFPDALSVQMQCRVMICRHSCPEHCHKQSLTNRNNLIQSRSDLGELTEKTVRASLMESFPTDNKNVTNNNTEYESSEHNTPVIGPRLLRFRRSEMDNLDHEYGVVQMFQAVSNTDLAFSPSEDDTVSVLAGHIASDGSLCLPKIRFTLIVISIVSVTLLAVGTSGIVCYRHFKIHSKKQAKVAENNRNKKN